MDELAMLKPHLKRLKLTGMLESLQMRIGQAMDEKWDYSHFLLNMVSDEVDRRDRKQLARILAKSGLEPDKTLETFDFSFNPTIHEQTIKELATCLFIERKQLIFFVGLADHVGQCALRIGRIDPSISDHIGLASQEEDFHRALTLLLRPKRQ